MDKTQMKDYLRQLRDRLGGKHIPGGDKVLDVKEWEDVGRPHVWKVVWSCEDAVVMSDSGYGCVALFENGDVVDVAVSYSVHGEKYVVVFDGFDIVVCRKLATITP